MNNLQTRLDHLINILNIPLEEKWEGINNKTYNLFDYWKTLELIKPETLENIYSGKTQLVKNPIIVKKFNDIDYYWPSYLYKNGIVADIGSGFGYFSFWFLLNGAKQVLSIGDPIRMQFVLRLYNVAVKKGLLPKDALIAKSSFVKVGDTTLSDVLNPKSLSLVFMHDTLEHITPRIFPSLVKSSYNSLKKGGKIISMQLNSDSPKMLEKIKTIWDKNEITLHAPYRNKCIKKLCKDINSNDLEQLTQKTRGLDSIDFQKAIDTYKLTGEFPVGTENLPAIDLKLDVPDEGNTSIKRITNVFKQNGFKTWVYPAMRHSKKSKPFQFISKLFPFFFFTFHIQDQTSVFIATKK